MVTVLVFLAVTLTLVSISQRYVGTSVCVERASGQAELRDQGSLEALARALDLLETGLPPSHPYVCATTVETPLGSRSYTVTYTSASGDEWLIDVAPTHEAESPDSMPESFAGP
jgi:hypothetical protein